VRKIAVDTQIPSSGLPKTSCQILTGSKRLMSGNANLMVVGSAARLQSCGPSELLHLCDLIYIIGLGLPVVVASSWRIAGGDSSRLVAQASGILLHAPAATNKVCTFRLGRALYFENIDARFALLHCATRPESKWEVVFDDGQPLAANQVRANSISQLAAAILKLKTLAKDGCRRYAIA
jgi:hypothetical protein